MLAFMRRTAVACLVLLGACGGVGGGSFSAPVTLGPPTSVLVPNSDFTCADGFPVQTNATFPQPFIGQGAASCTLVTYSNVQPTAAGKIVGATIGAGPLVGDMRFVRMRVLAEQSTGTACCSVEQLGDVFTPQPNGLTDVELDFPITHDVDTRTGIIANDSIGIEVLSPNVPIPGVWTQNGGPDLALPDYLWLPALSQRSGVPTQNLRSEGSYSGFVPTFSVRFAAAR